MKDEPAKSPLNKWYDLNVALKTLDETQCVELLKEEKAGHGRISFLSRIHNRINTMRYRRERKELREEFY